METQDFKDMQYGDLQALHAQLTKEEGYAVPEQKAHYATIIAAVTQAMSEKVEGLGLRADISGNLTTTEHHEGTVPQASGGDATASAHELAKGGDPAGKDPNDEAVHRNDPPPGVAPEKMSGRGTGRKK